MISEENWMSFHQKYSSDEFRSSSDYDRHQKKLPNIIGKLVKKCSSRKLLLPNDDINNSYNNNQSPTKNVLSRPSLSKASSSRNFSASLSATRLVQRRNSIARSA